MTFSIVARCPRTGQLGVAVATAVPAVGALCPFVRAKVGAVSTQSWVNPYLAIEALQRMHGGVSGPQALDRVIERDDGRDLRQVGVVDAQGRSAAWSGISCTEWYGHIVEPGFAVQGNMLVSAATVENMAAAYRASEPLDLTERLMLALEAGEAAGGDKRGRQSASLLVYDREDYALVDLRVDEHHHPVAELRRVLGIARLQLLPFVQGMPKKGGQGVPAPDSVVKMLGVPPPYRAGGGGSAP
ncbi:MAG TPA: DUF1028 domain-containing protein [Burkholderiales bacterium]|nr:DUF1028 domain-containing protein [Burkholderiales bacterium]